MKNRKERGRKTKAKRYQRELMKMAGYRGTNEIAGVLGVQPRGSRATSMK